MRRSAKVIAATSAALLLAGLAIPQRAVIPVEGASSNSWNHETFWYEPWGTSGVHKGIDIFGSAGTPVLAAVDGIVIYQGTLSIGGNVIAVLGPRWRIHYYAHLASSRVGFGAFVASGEPIGTVGTSGNAQGKPPHLHYTVLSLIPLPWQATAQTQGWKRMFFLNPQEILLGA